MIHIVSALCISVYKQLKALSFFPACAFCPCLRFQAKIPGVPIVLDFLILVLNSGSERQERERK